MSFNWKGYLELAQWMNDKASEAPDEEGCYRSVVSRAYYAAFCLGRNYVRDSENIIFSSDDHRKLQNHLKQSRDRNRTRIGNQLERLHDDRKKADYDDDLDELPVNKASKALTQAKKIVEGLERLSTHN